MKERWTTVTADSGAKQDTRFDAWVAGGNIAFISPEAEAAYRRRATMLRDAVQMKKAPERVPVCPAVGALPLTWAGLSWKDAMHDYEKMIPVWEKFYDEIHFDTADGPITVPPGGVFDLLDYKLYRWAGKQLGENQEFQYVEDEYMKDDEYQDLIDDPTGYFLTRYFPRVFGKLGAFQGLPNFPIATEYLLLFSTLMPFANPELMGAFSVMEAGAKELARYFSVLMRISSGLQAKGFPGFSGGASKMPFDLVGDTLRGTRGIFMDLFRRPDAVLEACERMTPFAVKGALAGSNMSGNPMVIFPLHKGADSFMSDELFRKFYWPTMRKVIVALINEGVVPLLFAEGGYNKRLKDICDLPKGKVIWWMDGTDMAQAKATVGQTQCLMGNVPSTILCTGTPDDVKDYCKNLIRIAGKDGGFILSTGASLGGTKIENARALMDVAKEYTSIY